MNKSQKLLLILCTLLGSLNLMAQNKLLKGKVTTADGSTPVAGATVSVKGGSSSVATSSDGTFSISVLPGTYTVTASTTSYSSDSKYLDSAKFYLTLRQAAD